LEGGELGESLFSVSGYGCAGASRWLPLSESATVLARRPLNEYACGHLLWPEQSWQPRLCRWSRAETQGIPTACGQFGLPGLAMRDALSRTPTAPDFGSSCPSFPGVRPNLRAKPFLRWAGSKRKQLTRLAQFWTDSHRRYIEPFAGSACLFFELMVVAASKRAQTEIGNRTDVQLMAHYNLTDGDNLFSDKCLHYSDDEKNTILSYCNEHFPDKPKGYGDCGLIFVMHHDCPNNSIPILHSHNKNKWHPLFPRASP